MIHHRKIFLLLSAASLINACGGGETQVQENPIPPPNNSPVQNYTGPAAATEDTQDFKINVWDNIATAEKCGACHIQNQQSPTFARNDDINEAYRITNSLIDKASPRDSLLITKVAGGHNCWLSSVEACTDLMSTWVANWLDTEETSTQIVLEPPAPRAVGANKNFPEEPSLFAENLHPLLQSNCSECHSSTAAIPISPYIGSADISEAYRAAIPKLNLDSPANSRLVVRVAEEFHNCWTDCAQDGESLIAAIQGMANSIPDTELDSGLVASHVSSMLEGTLASGGGRFEANIIAKWEFKTGTGNTAFDTSGVSPAINLTLSGGYDWVGGFGIQLTNGKAQGTTSSSKKLHDLITATGEYAIEAWIAPANVTQEGPARIVTYSGGDERRNFMLGQTLYNYNAALRHTNTDGNGEPFLSTDDADQDLQAALQHVVVNYSAASGRQIFVNGEFSGDEDDVSGGLLNDWDDSFAFALGSEVSGRYPFAGTIRMVAIHNRTLSAEQIESNFDAGIGQKFYVMFGISEIINAEQSYIVFEVSQFDSFSYLFAEPSVISLNENTSLDGIPLMGMRIGINGREEKTGQVFATLNKNIDTASSTLNSFGAIPISRQGTIIPVQKGPELDEFFLSFDTLGDIQSTRAEPTPPVLASPQDLPAQAELGVRHFAEINASMAALSQVDPQQEDVLATYTQLKQQLPSVTGLSSFLASNQMAITQLAIKYCDALVEDNLLRTAYFPNMNFAYDANGGFNETSKQAIISPLLTNMIGGDVVGQPNSSELTAEISALIDKLSACSFTNSCDANTTPTVVKASCAAVLGSAAVTLQ
ncbi:LamG domain-containing protein [Agaribacter flavus]|uniref:LamG domain-containing protein n=1 Tax=Agaribacter flavus TaxID=1902781 RepID=A0ABV7FMB5_9ALTE